MSIWLQKRLSVWIGASLLGGALLWNGGALRAQDEDETDVSPLMRGVGPRRALSRDDAAKTFVTFLEYVAEIDIRRNSTPYSTASYPSYVNMASSISQRSLGQLGNQTEKLLIEMATQWKRPNQSVKVQSETPQSATVIVETDATPPVRPVVLIQENGAWGVDLIETYARWNGLEGQKKALAIYELTGYELPELTLDGPFLAMREKARRVSCQLNLKQVALGLIQYTQDWDEMLPSAKSWIDATMPYIKSEQLFTCPSLPSGQKYGYAFNSKLSIKPLGIISSPSQTVELYETTILKRSAYGLGENRAFRHEGGANYLWADGHVKWLDQSKTPSFNLKP